MSIQTLLKSLVGVWTRTWYDDFTVLKKKCTQLRLQMTSQVDDLWHLDILAYFTYSESKKSLQGFEKCTRG